MRRDIEVDINEVAEFIGKSLNYICSNNISVRQRNMGIHGRLHSIRECNISEESRN